MKVVCAFSAALFLLAIGGISDADAAQERAFGKVGMKKPKKGKRKDVAP